MRRKAKKLLPADKPEPKIRLRERIEELASDFDLPPGVVFDTPQITLTGRSRVMIERHHGILDYAEDCIKVAANGVTIKISGMQLELIVMNDAELTIGGVVASVELLA